MVHNTIIKQFENYPLTHEPDFNKKYIVYYHGNVIREERKVTLLMKLILMSSVYPEAEDHIKTILTDDPDQINRQCLYGTTALILAVANIKEFIRHGGDNTLTDEDAILLKIIYQLIMAGADVNMASSIGDTAWTYALKRRIPAELIALMLSMGANINHQNKEGDTPLLIALRYKCESKVINMLLDADADINHQNKDGNTPLLLSLRYKCELKVINMLLDAGADINHQNKEGKSTLMSTYDIGLISMFIKAGVNVNHQDCNGQTALMLAVNGDNAYDKMNELISADANVNIRDKWGDTAIIRMIKFNNSSKKKLKLLISAGADIHGHGSHKRWNILMYAIERECKVTTYHILDMGLRLELEHRSVCDFEIPPYMKKLLLRHHTDPKIAIYIIGTSSKLLTYWGNLHYKRRREEEEEENRVNENDEES